MWLGLVGVRARLSLALEGYGGSERDTDPATAFSSQNFIKAKQYPPNTQVEVQNDGAESAVFQQLFQKWTLPNQTSGLGKIHNVGSVGEGPPEAGCPLSSFPDTPLPCALLPWLWAPDWGGDMRHTGKLRSCHKRGAEKHLSLLWNGIESPWEPDGFSLSPDNSC